MRARIAQFVIAMTTLVMLLPILNLIISLSLGKFERKHEVKVEGKEKPDLVTTSVAYFREDDFWRPIYVMIGLAVVAGLMFYVNVSKNKFIAMAVGLGTVVVFCIFGHALWPKGDPTVFLHGLGTIIAAFVALAVIWGGQQFSHWYTAKQAS